MTWREESPAVPGLYMVRPRRGALDGTGVSLARMPIRVVRIEADTDRFDAGVFGGEVSAPVWEWSGPIDIPDAM